MNAQHKVKNEVKKSLSVFAKPFWFRVDRFEEIALYAALVAAFRETF